VSHRPQLIRRHVERQVQQLTALCTGQLKLHDVTPRTARRGLSDYGVISSIRRGLRHELASSFQIGGNNAGNILGCPPSEGHDGDGDAIASNSFGDIQVYLGMGGGKTEHAGQQDRQPGYFFDYFQGLTS